MEKSLFIGGNLKNLRILYGYTQPSLAAKTGISEQDIWQYENHYKEPSFEHINQLKRVFHVHSMYFYQEDLLSKTQNVINEQYISFRFSQD